MINDSRWQRCGPLGGVVLVAPNAVVAMVEGTPPAGAALAGDPLALHIDAAGSSAPFACALGTLILAASGFGVATPATAANVAGWRARALTAWVVGCGALSAVAFSVSGVLTAIPAGKAARNVGLDGLVLWILRVTLRPWRSAAARLSVAGDAISEAPGVIAQAR